MSFWTGASAEKLKEAEAVLLRQARTPCEHRFVECTPAGDKIHTIVCGDPSKPPLVMTHGFGVGAAFWNLTLDHLSEHFHVYAIDWLGMGRSDRPKFTAKNADEAEKFFIVSLEEWRKNIGLEKFTLVGHSLGGYLSTVYALEYPERVSSLVLASPVGVPAMPEDEQSPKWVKHANWKVKAVVALVQYFWKRNITPQSVVRKVGHRGGSYLIGRFSKARFSHFPEEHRNALGDYIYHTSVMRGSGEYAFGTILRPFAWANKPLAHRLPQLKMPATFMYGDVDWMDPSAARAVSAKMSVPTKVKIISNAGHHLYMENADAVSTEIVAAAFGEEYARRNAPRYPQKQVPVMNRGRREFERKSSSGSDGGTPFHPAVHPA